MFFPKLVGRGCMGGVVGGVVEGVVGVVGGVVGGFVGRGCWREFDVNIFLFYDSMNSMNSKEGWFSNI